MVVEWWIGCQIDYKTSHNLKAKYKQEQFEKVNYKPSNNVEYDEH